MGNSQNRGHRRAAAASNASSGSSSSPAPSPAAAAASSSSGAAAAAAFEGADDVPAGASETERLSWYATAKLGYNTVVNAIIRPPRARYSERDLGPIEFEFRGRVFRRSDMEVRNGRGMRMLCSHWEPAPFNRPRPLLPCTIYMHGNSSCRVGCLENLEVVLAEGSTMFAFDFTGSGLSEGEYVTLGWYEKDDLAAVIDYLRRCGSVSSIALWGRSMGAATALMHAPRDPSIAGMILDSPFTDLRQLAGELVEMGKAQTGYKVPGFIVGAAIRMVRSTVSKKTGMDIFALRPIADVDKAFIPALFVAAEGDNFISPHHSKQIHEKYAGDKNLVLVPGDHNSLRPRFFQDSAAIFLRTVLQISDPGLSEDHGSWMQGALTMMTQTLGGGSSTTHTRTRVSTPRVPRADGVVASHSESVEEEDASVTHGGTSLEAAWRRAGDDSSVSGARASAVAAEEAMMQQALMASMLTASVGGVRAELPPRSPSAVIDARHHNGGGPRAAVAPPRTPTRGGDITTGTAGRAKSGDGTYTSEYISEHAGVPTLAGSRAAASATSSSSGATSSSRMASLTSWLAIGRGRAEASAPAVADHAPMPPYPAHPATTLDDGTLMSRRGKPPGAVEGVPARTALSAAAAATASARAATPTATMCELPFVGGRASASSRSGAPTVPDGVSTSDTVGDSLADQIAAGFADGFADKPAVATSSHALHASGGSDEDAQLQAAIAMSIRETGR